MRMQWIKIKKTRDSLAYELRLMRQYRDLYLMASGFVIPPAYTQAAMARIVTDRAGRVIGAYCYNDGQAQFRYIGFDPAKAQAALAEQGLSLSDLSELTGIVFGPAMSRLQRQYLYVRIGLDLALSGKRVIMGGSLVPGIRRVQKQLMRHTLFTTMIPVAEPDGEVRLRELEVYYAFRHEVMPLLCRALATDILRQIRPRKRVNYTVQGG